MAQTPVIFVLGPPGHGKTLARKLLAELVVQTGRSTSEAIYHFIALMRGVTVASLRDIPKEELRPLLIQVGDYIVGARPDIPLEDPKDPGAFSVFTNDMYRGPSALVRMLYLGGANVIDGVRRTAELASAKEHLEWNGVPHYTIWIERSQGPVIPDNTELTALDADEVVMNDGTPEELRVLLFAALERRFGRQDEVGKDIPIADSPAQAGDIMQSRVKSGDL
jgi:hypothetical protein